MTVMIAIALLSGLTLAFSLPPFDAGIVAWFAFVPFFAAVDMAAPSGKGSGWRSGHYKRSFITGYAFGFIFFLSTVYWVVNSIHNFGGVPIVQSIGIMVLLAAYLALYPALFALALTICRPAGPAWSFFLYPSLWVALEYLRGTLFPAFPWVLTGYSQAGVVELIQIADIFGVYGVSFLVISVNAGIYLSLKAASGLKGRWLRDGGLPLLLALVVFTAALCYGFMKLSATDLETRGLESALVGVAQGNIEQSMKWAPETQLETVETYARLSETLALSGASLIVWPETAAPFFLAYDDQLGAMVKGVSARTGSHIITGAPHYEYRGGSAMADQFNSAFLISPDDAIISRYDKVKLVPFGEYVPFKSILFFIDKITEGIGDFSSGPGHFPLKIEGGGEPLNIGMLICFESIFPDIAAASVRSGANMLVTITNDAWFGRTSAPYQHFQMSILRAVENRIFVVRSANTGISGVIDPAGRVVKKTGLFEEAAFTERVGLRVGEPTFFAANTWLVPVATILFSLAGLVCGISSRRGGSI